MLDNRSVNEWLFGKISIFMPSLCGKNCSNLPINSAGLRLIGRFRLMTTPLHGSPALCLKQVSMELIKPALQCMILSSNHDRPTWITKYDEKVSVTMTKGSFSHWSMIPEGTVIVQHKFHLQFLNLNYFQFPPTSPGLTAQFDGGVWAHKLEQILFEIMAQFRWGEIPHA